LRPAHLALAKAAHDNGQMLMAGAHADASGATFVFSCDDDKPVRAFVAGDPYVVSLPSLRSLASGEHLSADRAAHALNVRRRTAW
jgi:hypothetical protein